MDKADGTAREHIAKSADLIAAIRLPERSFRTEAGTNVVVDILFLRKRKVGEPEGDLSWLDIEEVRPAANDEGAIRVNRWFARHPDFVLGRHALMSGPFGETYTCLPRQGAGLDAALSADINLLPKALYDGEPTGIDFDIEDADDHGVIDLPALHVREGGFFFDNSRGPHAGHRRRARRREDPQGGSADGVPEKQCGPSGGDDRVAFHQPERPPPQT